MYEILISKTIALFIQKKAMVLEIIAFPGMLVGDERLYIRGLSGMMEMIYILIGIPITWAYTFVNTY